MKRFLHIDIGSTFTKGAVFIKEGTRLKTDACATVRTQREDLSASFFDLTRELAGASDVPGMKNWQSNGSLRLSSSARGGLSVAAVGVVPEWTLEMARLTALTAGARITATFSYSLTDEDIELLRTHPPDIILLTGGTDGGHEKAVLQNAAALRAAELPSVVIYAGNRTLRPAMKDLFAERPFRATDNVLPRLDSPDPEPARKAIRDVFLTHLIAGKGLETLARELDVTPLPTPRVVYEFLRAIPALIPEWQSFCAVDLGGATTDYYSCAPAHGGQTDVIIRGLAEPFAKRTVEGDLGMRVSAPWAGERFSDYYAAADAGGQGQDPGFDLYTRRVQRDTGFLPQQEKEQRYDRQLAAICHAEALRRHAGRRREVCTAAGPRPVQEGKNLCPVTKVIVAGGYYARIDCEEDAMPAPLPQMDANGNELLVPQSPQYWADREGQLPLIAHFLEDAPREAALSWLDNLNKLEPHRGSEGKDAE